MTLKIIPIPALTDNYIWLLIQNQEAICIDPAQAEPVQAVLDQQQLTLKAILITHHHHDHTAGIAALKANHPACSVKGFADINQAEQILTDGEQWTWGECQIRVHQSAGHTAGHCRYHVQHQNQIHLFVGDTLFSAGCGRVFPPSRPEWLYESLQAIQKLPEDSLIYPAHEYTAANLRFAAHIEPNNSDIQAAIADLSQPSLPVTLAHEQKINPFLRVHLPHIAQRVSELSGQNLNDSCVVFIALRELKNHF